MGDGRSGRIPASCRAESYDSGWRHFDFVEVGTPDFRTLTQFLDGTDTSCFVGNALRTWRPAEAVGLAVDPVWHLLDRLPELHGVRKVQAAIGAADGWQTLHYVRKDAVQRYPRAYSAGLARGTATLGDPHPKLLDCLRRDGIALPEIMTLRQVPVWSF